MKKILITISVIISVCIIVFVIMQQMGKDFYEETSYNDIQINLPDDIMEDEISSYLVTQYFEYYKQHGKSKQISDYNIKELSVLEKESDYIVIACSYDVKPFFDDSYQWLVGNVIKLENGWYYKYKEYKFRIVNENIYILESVSTGG